MKLQWLLPATIVMSVTLVGILKIRKKEHDKHDKQNKFQDIRLRVAYDVLGEYQNEKAEKQNLLEKTNTDQKALEEQMNELQIKADKAKGDADVCQADQKTVTDQLAAVETELKILKVEQEKEKMSWKKEEEALKQKLVGHSLVCVFLKKDSIGARNLCGAQAAGEAKKEEPKAEAPKQEEAKGEAPKQEEAKAAAPKQEEAKAAAPKQEEAKAKAPKQEEAKAKAPKQEEAKAKAPKS